MYCAIIGDLIGSRQIEASERYVVQEKLKDILNGINYKYSEIIASNFLITLGDEFQGLLRVSWPSIEIIEYIIEELYPLGIRFGVGLGDIYTEIDFSKAIGADGPAYHLARECINTNKKKCQKDGFMVIFKTGNSDSLLINALCSSISDIMSSWTQKQRKTVWVTKKNNDLQKLTAKALGINTSSVTRSLKAAKYISYRRLLTALKEYLRTEYDFSGVTN